ncbi:hypothetical protein [Shewanella hanedai]|uniref:Uncharacterized protein n=1 Tax=Shewanella hanedai TaxID=25 RepID=A0A553JUH4_SHEHA|nr:hypothetical protein [Shewanella hanedai]TRY16094.1 hypothetical protein FN961_00205 [Shewanella hanedai]
MEIGVGIEADAKSNIKVKLVSDFMADLSKFLKPINYGQGVLSITIGFICNELVPGYESWHKERKPRFTRNRKVKLLSGDSITSNNNFSYDMKFSDDEYASFIQSTDDESTRVFAIKLIDSLSTFDDLPRSVSDFNVGQFKADIENFVNSKLGVEVSAKQ